MKNLFEINLIINLMLVIGLNISKNYLFHYQSILYLILTIIGIISMNI